MTNKKIWAATLFSTLLLTMTISSPVKAAELQTSTTVDRSQIPLLLSEETEENLFSLESVSDIQMSELVDPDEVISVSDGDDTIQARKGTATKYGWSYGTTPYTFTQKWSTDTEVYSTYPYYNDGLLYPAATELLDAPSNSQYSSAVREGYVNDTWATEQSIVGAHVYYHKVSSNKALKMLENLLLSGFDKKTSLELINSSLINQNEEIFATLDIAIIDLYKGNIELIKSGACPTYIKNKSNVQLIKASSLPAGIINETSLQTFDRDISSGEIMLMCTDGILDSNVEYKNKELWVKYLFEDIETNNTKKIADLVLNEAIDNGYGTAKDDMSVVVCKFLDK